MELEAVICSPVVGSTMTIPTRERVFRPGVAGPRIVDSSHVADVAGLRTVELEDGVPSSSRAATTTSSRSPSC